MLRIAHCFLILLTRLFCFYKKKFTLPLNRSRKSTFTYTRKKITKLPYSPDKKEVCLKKHLIENICFSSIQSTTNSSFRLSSPPIQIPQIPPYKKSLTTVVNPSPPRIPEIPAYKPRKSNDWEPKPSEGEFQLQLPPGASPDWAKRLKATESTAVHRSVDCIPNKVTQSDSFGKDKNNCTSGFFQELIPPPESDLKPAPSWTNVATRTESTNSSSGVSVKTPSDEDAKGKNFCKNFFFLFNLKLKNV